MTVVTVLTLVTLVSPCDPVDHRISLSRQVYSVFFRSRKKRSASISQNVRQHGMVEARPHGAVGRKICKIFAELTFAKHVMKDN